MLKRRMDRGEGRISTALIYDGACPLCTAAARWIGDHEVAGSFEMVQCQSERRRTRFSRVIRTECMTAVHLVLPDGTVLAGEHVLPAVVARLRGYRIAAPLFRMPGVPALTRAVYRWFAPRRYRAAALLSHLARPERPGRLPE